MDKHNSHNGEAKIQTEVRKLSKWATRVARCNFFANHSHLVRYNGVTFKGSFTFYALKRGSQYEVNQESLYMYTYTYIQSKNHLLRCSYICLGFGSSAQWGGVESKREKPICFLNANVSDRIWLWWWKVRRLHVCLVLPKVKAIKTNFSIFTQSSIQNSYLYSSSISGMTLRQVLLCAWKGEPGVKSCSLPYSLDFLPPDLLWHSIYSKPCHHVRPTQSRTPLERPHLDSWL